ncbi:hypothetical protein SAMD00019534_119120, partial [Acytostelium subglobosum LB1]|uniref:hypothetical protein n=1 Tax=Acytostelium subglobosum LB1 TaxID=1410327 RepID=UPI000644CD6F
MAEAIIGTTMARTSLNNRMDSSSFIIRSVFNVHLTKSQHIDYTSNFIRRGCPATRTIHTAPITHRGQGE